MKFFARLRGRAVTFCQLRHSSRHHATCAQIMPDNHQHDDLTLIQHQLNLASPVDTLRYILLHDMRPLLHQMDVRSTAQGALPRFSSIPFPINGQMLDFNDLRQLMALKPYTKLHRRILTEQFLRCETPRQILRVLAVALQRKESTQDLANLDLCLVRAFYRAREKATDAKILEAINVVVTRFRHENLRITPYMLAIGIRFAARSRSLPGMKRYLKLYRELGFRMSRNTFRAIIAKFSVGNKGYGEIRNGRWSRRDLLQVLLGFEDTTPANQHHLGLFLDRSEWTQLIAWIVVLGRCKASDEVYKEWLLWQDNPIRLKPRGNQSEGVSAKARNDYCFIEAMANAGDTHRAWLMLRESGLPFQYCRKHLRHQLLRDIQHATLWDEQIPLDMLEYYTSEITKIENALGVEWISLGDDQGYHKPTDSMKQSLEVLSSPFFKLDPNFGYPYDASQEEIQAQQEQMKLHVEDIAIYLPKTDRKVNMTGYNN